MSISLFNPSVKVAVVTGAGPVIFLTWDAASFVTGHILIVNGSHSVDGTVRKS